MTADDVEGGPSALFVAVIISRLQVGSRGRPRACRVNERKPHGRRVTAGDTSQPCNGLLDFTSTANEFSKGPEVAIGVSNPNNACTTSRGDVSPPATSALDRVHVIVSVNRHAYTESPSTVVRKPLDEGPLSVVGPSACATHATCHEGDKDGLDDGAIDLKGPCRPLS